MLSSMLQTPTEREKGSEMGAEKEEIFLAIAKGAGSIIKGDRVNWCDGLDGTVLGVCMNLIMVETDDGITRMSGEKYLTLCQSGPRKQIG